MFNNYINLNKKNDFSQNTTSKILIKNENLQSTFNFFFPSQNKKGKL